MNEQNQQEAIMQFVQALAQTLQANPEDIIRIVQQKPETLEVAVQVFQQTQDINQAAQAFVQAANQQQQGAPQQMARHGAKLNYIKSLKHQCDSNEELVYFKKGGRVGCGCVKKEQKGGKQPEKMSSVESFKISRHKEGNPKLPTAPKAREAYAGGTYYEDNRSLADKVRKRKVSTVTEPMNRNKIPRSISQTVTSKGDTIYSETPGNDGTVRVKERTAGKNSPDYSTMKRRYNEAKSVATTRKEKKIKVSACGSKVKKHENGGSLNGILFYQGGTNKGGLPTAPKVEDRYKDSKKQQYTSYVRGFTSDSTNIKQVSSGKPTLFGHPAVIRQVVDYGRYPYDNDTTYIEIPEVNNPFIKRKIRGTNKHIGVLRDYYSHLIPFFGKFLPDSLGSSNKKEYEILKRRFNTAWNLAK